MWGKVKKELPQESPVALHDSGSEMPHSPGQGACDRQCWQLLQHGFVFYSALKIIIKTPILLMGIFKCSSVYPLTVIKILPVIVLCAFMALFF